MSTVLIPSPVDLIQTTALRALGRRGDICHVACESGKNRVSRFCRRFISVPNAEKDPEAYVTAIIDLCKTRKYDVILPTSMATLEVLAQHANTLAEFSNILFPSVVQVEIGMDKRRTIEMCRKFGFAHPATVFLEDDSDLVKIGESFGFPLIVKHERNFGGSFGVRCVSAMNELSLTVKNLSQLGGGISHCMVQKFVPGALFDACVVAHNGKVARIVTQVRHLMYPISGGVAAHLVSVENSQLRDLAANIISALNWTGPIQLEFKWDAESHEFSLIEINPRFWGTTGAWARAGFDFPGVAVDLAMGGTVQAIDALPGNLRFKYLIGRTPYALVQLMRAKGWAAMRDPNKYDQTWHDFDLRDPGPDVWRIYDEIRKLLRGERILSDTSLPVKLLPVFTKVMQ